MKRLFWTLITLTCLSGAMWAKDDKPNNNKFTAMSGNNSLEYYVIDEENKKAELRGVQQKTSLEDPALIVPATALNNGVPYTITQIAGRAFSGESGITSVTLPEGLVSIEDYAFEGCTGISSLTLPQSLEKIGYDGFARCSGIQGTLTIPSAITEIGNYAFAACTKIEKVVFEGCSFHLSSERFKDCAALDTIHFTEQVKDMSFDRNAFGANSVNTILYDAVDWGEKHESIFGCINLNNTSTLAKSVTKIIIGENVQRIPSGIFKYFNKVVEVELHDGITYIGQDAFSSMTLLKNMPIIPMNDEFAVIGGGVKPTSIGRFYDIDADGQMEVISDVIEEVTVDVVNAPDTVRSYIAIGTNTGIKKEEIIFQDSVTSLDDRTLLTIDNIDRKGGAEVLVQQDANWALYDVNTREEKTQFEISGSYNLAFDANGDGRTDYFSGLESESFIAYQQADGTFLTKEIQIITDPDEIGEAAFAQYEPNPGAPMSIVFSGVSMAKAPRQQKMSASTKAPQKQIASEMFEGGEPQTIDLNMDGLLDIVNLHNGNCLLSLGNDKYYYGTMDGEVIAKDLTGDGVPDYVIHNKETHKVTLQLYVGDGQFATKQLYQNAGISGIHCYDFDKDGDVDILLTFDYNEAMNASFCGFFENRDNEFIKRERGIVGRKLYFLDLKDYDNDGQYELVAYEPNRILDDEVIGDEIYYDAEFVYTVKCKSNFSVEVSDEPFFIAKLPTYLDGSISDEYSFFSSDADSDGFLETWITDVGVINKESTYTTTTSEGTFKCYHFHENQTVQGRIFNTTPNTAPEKMNTPRALFDNTNNILRLEWDKGVDAQQSSADLTYAIRIGTESGKGDIVYAHADATGRRLRAGEGNAAYNLYKYYMTEAWNAGTYYIAIQAIDNNGAGGVWSEELVFELATQNSEFDLSATHLTVNDTLILQPRATFNPAFTYNWDFGTDATLVKNELGVWQVQYSTTGHKTISLQVLAEGEENTKEAYSTEIFVSGMDLETKNRNAEPNYEGNYPGFYRYGSFVDLDMDGRLDLLGSSYNDHDQEAQGVLESNGDGTFAKYAGMYNGDMTLTGGAIVLDLNMDGHPDFLSQESGKANASNWFINNEYFDFSDEQKTFIFPNFDEYYLENYGENLLEVLLNDGRHRVTGEGRADFNNDGYEDFYFIYNGANIAINQGDNFTFKQVSEEYDGIFGNTEELIIAAIDMNNDGWLDLITEEWVGDASNDGANLKRCIRWNNGDMTFNEKTEMTVHGDAMNDGEWAKRMADFNNDGYLDLIFSQKEDPNNHESNTTCIVIYPGDETYSYANPIYITDYKDNIQLASGGYGSGNYVDFDNNGYLDLQVGVDGEVGRGGGSGILYLYEGWETKFVRNADIGGEEHYDIPTSLFADLNGDGTPDFTNANMISTLPNERPAAPNGVRATVGNKGMNLSWNAAMDKETPSAQMRYNISLKIKGESGENSYILSPLNDGVDYIAPVSSKEYLRGTTTYTVPFSRFVSGTQYELKVQAFDLWNSASAFSETFTFTMSDDLFVTGADKACVGNAVTLTVSGNNAQGGGTPVWNVGGGEIVENDGNSIQVLWDTPELKEVSVAMNGKEGKAAVMVHETLDLEFDLPNTILSGGYVYFTLPEAFLDPSNKVKIRTSFDADPFSINQGEFVSVGGVIELIPAVAVANKDGIAIERRGSTLEARILVNANDGDYWMEFVAEDKNCGSVSYRQNFEVQGRNITPQISIVTVDATTGKNKIMWDEPADLDTQNGVYDKIIVFKEMGATENYLPIAEVPIAQGSFVDPSSDPYLRKGRYRISLGTTYGGVSNPSKTHASVHVMLNKGVAPNSVNIVWTPYEGAVIDQYTILRGTNPNNLQVLTTASGYETSYTDMTMPAGDVYYALQYSNTYVNEWNPMRAPARVGMMKVGASGSVAVGVSNAVNANAASMVTLAEFISINHIQADAELSPAQSTLLLYTEIAPAMATYKQANWRITEGAHLATITQDGMLVYTGNGENGTVVVRATTLDGSALSAQLSVVVKDFSPTNDEIVHADASNIKVMTRHGKLSVFGAEGKLIRVFNMFGQSVQVINKATAEQELDLPQQGAYVLLVDDMPIKVMFAKQ